LFRSFQTDFEFCSSSISPGKRIYECSEWALGRTEVWRGVIKLNLLLPLASGENCWVRAAANGAENRFLNNLLILFMGGGSKIQKTRAHEFGAPPEFIVRGAIWAATLNTLDTHARLRISSDAFLHQATSPFSRGTWRECAAEAHTFSFFLPFAVRAYHARWWYKAIKKYFRPCSPCAANLISPSPLSRTF